MNVKYFFVIFIFYKVIIKPAYVLATSMLKIKNFAYGMQKKRIYVNPAMALSLQLAAVQKRGLYCFADFVGPGSKISNEK